MQNETSVDTSNNGYLYLIIILIILFIIIIGVVIYFVLKKPSDSTNITPQPSIPLPPAPNPVSPSINPSSNTSDLIYNGVNNTLSLLNDDFKKTFGNNPENSNIWATYSSIPNNYICLNNCFDKFIPNYNFDFSNVTEINLYGEYLKPLSFDNLNNITITNSIHKPIITIDDVFNTDNITNDVLSFFNLYEYTDISQIPDTFSKLSPIYNNCYWKINDSSMYDLLNGNQFINLDISKFVNTNDLDYLYNNPSFKYYIYGHFKNIVVKNNQFTESIFNKYLKFKSDETNFNKIYNSIALTECEPNEYLINSIIKPFTDKTTGETILIMNRKCCFIDTPDNIQQVKNNINGIYKTIFSSYTNIINN